jgi:tetratricopeptide (TPR) repeat protein
MQQLDKAQAELERLAGQHDAMGFIGIFVDLGIKLQRGDVVEAVLTKATSPAMEVPVRFRLVEFYRMVDDRPKAFRTLMKLAEFCQDQPDQLAVIANHLLAIGEARYSLELREKLRRRTPEDLNRVLDVIEARIPVHTQRAVAELQDLQRTQSLNATQWERVSIFYERIGLFKKALRAINGGLTHPDAHASLQARKVYLLLLLNRRYRARRELMASIDHPRADFFYLRVLAELALRINERELALQCAQLQFRLAPHSPDAILYYTRCRRTAGEYDAAREQLSALFERERRYPSFADYQWIALTQELFDSGLIALAKEAALEVCARNPHELTVKQVLMKIALLEKHGTRDTLSHRVAPARAGSRVGRIFAMLAPRRG